MTPDMQQILKDGFTAYKIAAVVAKEYGIEAADSEKIVFDGLWRILQKYVSDKPNENQTETK